MGEFRECEILESLLDRAREITLLSQSDQPGFGEGIDLGLAYALLGLMRDEAKTERLEIVSGRGDAEQWKEVNASGLPRMFKNFRSIFAAQLAERFKLDSTPDKHTLLALKMHPAINTDLDGPQLRGKSAKAELMQGEYKRALRRQAKVIEASRGIFGDDPNGRGDAISAAAVVEDVWRHDASALGPNKNSEDHGAKRRKGLMGAMIVAQKRQQDEMHSDEEEDEQSVDASVKSEIEAFELISQRILTMVRYAFETRCPHSRIRFYIC